MRRLGIFLAVMVIMMLVLIPVLAQSTIADFIDNQSKYSILQEFLEAAPDVQEKLDSLVRIPFLHRMIPPLKIWKVRWTFPWSIC